MKITEQKMNKLKESGVVEVYANGRHVLIVNELDSETRLALYKLYKVIFNWTKLITPTEVKTMMTIACAPTELKEHFHTIMRALKRKEEMFLESYASEEEFTAAANVYRKRYKLVNLSYKFADETSKKVAAVWEVK